MEGMEEKRKRRNAEERSKPKGNERKARGRNLKQKLMEIFRQPII